jgi:hypothetical protein
MIKIDRPIKFRIINPKMMKGYHFLFLCIRSVSSKTSSSSELPSVSLILSYFRFIIAVPSDVALLRSMRLSVLGSWNFNLSLTKNTKVGNKYTSRNPQVTPMYPLRSPT